MKRLIAAILATALMAASAFGVEAAEKPEAITVAYFPEWPTANQVAQAERWYDEEMGLEVTWRQFQSGVDMARAMVAGEVEISYSMGIIPFIGAVSEGAPLTAVGIAVSYAENDNCVVHRKAAIDKANAHELEGKKVAVPFGTVTHYKLLRTLDFLAVDTSKLDLVDMVSAKGAEALARGEVTMACGWGGALRRMLGKNRVLMSAREQTKIGIRTFDVVAVTNDLAEKYPDLVTAFLRVSDRAADYLDDDPDRAQPIIAQAAGLSPRESDILLARFQFYTREAQLTGTWMRGGVQAFAKEVADFMVGQGVMAKSLDDYGPTFDADFYERVR
jgi:taurine transport system substrate-binding protein